MQPSNKCQISRYLGLFAGSTILDVLGHLMARGASQEYIRIIAALVAPEALEAIAKQFPGVHLPGILIAVRKASGVSWYGLGAE